MQDIIKPYQTKKSIESKRKFLQLKTRKFVFISGCWLTQACAVKKF